MRALLVNLEKLYESMMGGSGMMDFMVKSYRNNRGLLKGGKKSLKKIYQENNYFYSLHQKEGC